MVRTSFWKAYLFEGGSQKCKISSQTIVWGQSSTSCDKTPYLTPDTCRHLYYFASSRCLLWRDTKFRESATTTVNYIWLSSYTAELNWRPRVLIQMVFFFTSAILAVLAFWAGHATMLTRQRDHVFRPQSCLLLQYYYIWCGYTPSGHRDLNRFQKISGPWGSFTLLRCPCREAIKLSSAQLCLHSYKHVNPLLKTSFVKQT